MMRFVKRVLCLGNLRNNIKHFLITWDLVNPERLYIGAVICSEDNEMLPLAQKSKRYCTC